MTVTTDTVAAISPYIVGTDYTTAEFTLYKGWAEARFNREDPGLESAEADMAVGFLVCHYIKTFKKNGGTLKQSESIGGYSYSAADPQGYLGQYQALIKSRSPQPYRGVQRGDMETSRDFQLSENKIPQMRYTDSNRKKPYD